LNYTHYLDRKYGDGDGDFTGTEIVSMLEQERPGHDYTSLWNSDDFNTDFNGKCVDWIKELWAYKYFGDAEDVYISKTAWTLML